MRAPFARPFVLTATTHILTDVVVRDYRYFTAYKSCVGRHRDNWSTDHFCRYLDGEDLFGSQEGHSASSDTNSQVVGSDVLIWTIGNAPMVMKLSFANSDDLTQSRNEYVVHPAYSIPCAHGTLLVFPAIDDLFFCHEACFEPQVLDAFGNSGYRFAYVFRWLQSKREFYISSGRKHAMKVPEELQEKLAASKYETQKRKRRCN